MNNPDATVSFGLSRFLGKSLAKRVMKKFTKEEIIKKNMLVSYNMVYLADFFMYSEEGNINIGGEVKRFFMPGIGFISIDALEHAFKKYEVNCTCFDWSDGETYKKADFCLLKE
jgi:hypothetical protein